MFWYSEKLLQLLENILRELWKHLQLTENELRNRRNKFQEAENRFHKPEIFSSIYQKKKKKDPGTWQIFCSDQH